MAKRIRVPGIVDLLRVTTPEEIRMLDEAPRIDRAFAARGPLINRLVFARIRRWFHVNGLPLPALASRADATRAARQRTLTAALDPAAHRLWTEAQVEQLAVFVRSVPAEHNPRSDDKPHSEEAAILVQEIVGRLFDANYAADRASWKAAEMIDRFRDRFSPVQILWLIAGRLRRARALLLSRSGDDRWSVHGTAIGVHGIVRALERMQALRAAPQASSLGEDAVLARCLKPPRQVPRAADAMMATPAAAAPLRPGTLVIFGLEAAGAAAPGPEMTFMRGHWNTCPAQAFVVDLLKTVWRRSL